MADEARLLLGQPLVMTLDPSTGGYILKLASGASESHIGTIGGTTARAKATLTRPANTTAYADGQSVASSTGTATALTFSNVARVAGGTGVILSAVLVDKAYAASQPTGFELWLFRSAAPTVSSDGSAFALTQSDLNNFVTVIPFTTSYAGNKTVGVTGSVVWNAPNLGRGFVCSGDANLYGVLKINGAYTPISAEVFDIVLKTLDD